MTKNLPPLPNALGRTYLRMVSGDEAYADRHEEVYTAEQMKQYGQECWAVGRVHGQGDTKPHPDNNRLISHREKISEHVTVLHLTEEGRKCITLANEVLIPAADPVWRRT